METTGIKALSISEKRLSISMIEIKFKKNNILFSLYLSILGLAVSVYVLFHLSLIVQLISVFWIAVIAHVIYTKSQQLTKAKKGMPALEINDHGITNNTSPQPIYLRWGEITSFQTGFYRNNNILINPKDPEKYRNKEMNQFFQIIGSIFSSKPEVLWIDTDVLNIKKDELLRLLNRKLYKN